MLSRVVWAIDTEEAELPARSTPESFWANVDKSDLSGCWPWNLGTDEYGYGRVRYHQKEYHASRLAFILTYGDPGLLDVCHHCDNPPCCNPIHLFKGTKKDNSQDMVRKGRHPRNKTGYLPTGSQHHSHRTPEVLARGERNGAAVLTEKQVHEIRKRRRKGETLRALAKVFNVAKGTINFIVTGKTWKHVTDAKRVDPPKSGGKP